MSDLIERQAAIDALRREYNTDDSDYPTEYQLGLSAGRRIIDALPSAQFIEPERKKGKWIDEGFYADGHGAHAFRCSECGGHIIEYDTDPFCKWCGADMRGEQDETN